MERAYVLHHVLETKTTEDAKLIGIYSSRQAAEAAIARLRAKPGFRLPNGEFTIDAYKVDEDNWTEGFGAE